MVITDQKKADEVCQAFSKEPVIAVDTEFLWTRTYYAQPSLVQLASSNEHYIIDLIALKDYHSLGKLLSADNIKVFHSGDQDLRLLKKATGISCNNFFDSQLAAAFLNLDYQISYNRLVKHYCQLELPPSVSHLNWLERPLTTQQIDYALNDVIYLIQLYPKLIEELNKYNKYNWIEEDISNNFGNDFYKNPLPPTYKSIKQWHDLPPNKLAILNELVIMRDKIAQEVKKRPSFTIHDNLLIYLCHKPQLNNEVFKSIKINSPFKEKYASQIINAWQKGHNTPIEEYPKLTKKTIASPKIKIAENEIKKLIKQKAQKHNLHPTLLLSVDKQRKIISQWQANNQTKITLNNWRKNILESELVKILSQIND